MDIQVDIPAWVRYAECGPLRRNIDPELFYPGQGEPIAPEVAGACGACQVREQCLAWGQEAEEGQERFGIWGGYTGRGRTDLVRGRNPSPVYSITYRLAHMRKRVA